MKNLGNNIISGLFWRFGERIFAQGVSFIISLVFLLFSCVEVFQHKHEYVAGVCNCGEKEPAKYTVIFKNYDGKTINSQQV